MSAQPRATWRFPPRNGGIDYVNDPSSTHFSDARIAKLVSELIQNSLDAKHDGFADPVTVTFSETSVKRGLIGGTALRRHLQSCLDRATDDDRSDMVDCVKGGVILGHGAETLSELRRYDHLEWVRKTPRRVLGDRMRADAVREGTWLP